MGEGPQELKVSGAGEGGGLDIFPIYEERSLAKEERVFSLPHFGRQGACHDITKSADSQTNINFFSKWLYNCRNSTKKPNDFRLRILGNKKVFEKTQIGWRQILVASQLSRNKFLVIVVKIYTEAHFKVYWYCKILLDFFAYFQIFCPGWQVFVIPWNTL